MMDQKVETTHLGNKVSKNYIDSYSDLKVHSLMLKDEQRLDAYRKAIFSNPDFWAEKVVLDVGAGTGILSLYCAKSGAKKIFAVEANEPVCNVMRDIVKENNFEHVIEIFNSQVEDVCLPCKVDVIISEWMGFYLLHEGMLDSVLVARDKFLKEGGLIMPDVCNLYVVPCHLPEYFDYWSDVDGIKMNSFGSRLRNSLSSPEILEVNPSWLLVQDIKPTLDLDLYKVKVEELQEISFKFFSVSNVDGKYQGLCIWFDVSFPKLYSNGEAVVLSTSPFMPVTHWKQTAIVLNEEIEVENGEALAGSVLLKKVSSNNQSYLITVELSDTQEVEHPLKCTCDMIRCKITRECLKMYGEQDDQE